MEWKVGQEVFEAFWQNGAPATGRWGVISRVGPRSMSIDWGGMRSQRESVWLASAGQIVPAQAMAGWEKFVAEYPRLLALKKRLESCLERFSIASESRRLSSRIDVSRLADLISEMERVLQ